MPHLNLVMEYSKGKNNDIYNLLAWCARNPNSKTAAKITAALRESMRGSSAQENIRTGFKQLENMPLENLFERLVVREDCFNVANQMGRGYNICESCGRYSETIYEENDACVCPECAGQV